MIVSPRFDIHSVLVAETDNKTMHIPISMQLPGVNQNVKTKALINSAARGRFIDQNFV